MSRAAGLAMVAYDSNALDSQLLQGWLMRDRFLMRGSLGAVYAQTDSYSILAEVTDRELKRSDDALKKGIR